MLSRILLATLLISTPAMAASFDCQKAEHPLEKTICGNKILSDMDKDVADYYQKKLGNLFDKNALRGQQADWQQGLRKKCETSCDPKMVETDYMNQLAVLRDLKSEIYTANYKTADIATLEITHISPEQFDFTITRDFVDDPGIEPLCLIPSGEAEAGAIATMNKDGKSAQWTNGECTLDFAMKQDEKGSVVGITIDAAEACRSYCKDGKYTLSDNFIPENNWAAGSQ